jgi:hypothetical protein
VNSNRGKSHNFIAFDKRKRVLHEQRKKKRIRKETLQRRRRFARRENDLQIQFNQPDSKRHFRGDRTDKPQKHFVSQQQKPQKHGRIHFHQSGNGHFAHVVVRLGRSVLQQHDGQFDEPNLLQPEFAHRY